jgi:hypothetical protein
MPNDEGRPSGFIPIGIFFVFGATMAAYASVTLIAPGTALDVLWALNSSAHVQLAALGKVAGLGFAALSLLLCAASLGWFRRRYWGWLLGTTIIAINAVGDLVNGLRGAWLEAAAGVSIAGLLLLYLTRAGTRKYFGSR